MWLRAHERLPGVRLLGGHMVSDMGAVPDLSAIVDALDLEPHPEGGWYRRVWTATTKMAGGNDRATASSILYLLGDGDSSAWHRLTDAEEVWVHQSGDPVDLHISPDGQTERIVRIGPPGVPDAVPTATVPIGAWQSAEVHRPGASDSAAGTATGWSLLTCVVSPEFRFEGFELAPIAIHDGDEGFLAASSFEANFRELYRFYKDAHLVQLSRSETRVFAIFQIGNSLSDVRVFRWGLDARGRARRAGRLGDLPRRLRLQRGGADRRTLPTYGAGGVGGARWCVR